ncbi:MAG: nitrite reductase small subunit NirD [Acidobacteriota bacterium]
MFAAELEQIPAGDALVVTVAGRELALFRLGDEVFALENFCPHRGGPIGEGLVREGHVTCPWHEWTFDIKTGLCTLNPAARVRTFPAKVVDGSVWVLPEPEA